ncbi:hypothetical protein L1987_72299 [Smallanthus sonchifolius]|uniref:Uncharacterized protein n=1 Tax=Smallanthus sonchifolius TaxID=185202 RepID=A0ACB9AV84_9ASTR|nr:hypothetical protein L1987_72299 [Smallanthus sonchifolius]
MATLQSPRYIAHFTSLKTVTHLTTSYRRTLPPSFLHLRIRRRSATMASSTDASESPAAGNSESTSDVLVQYVVLRRDLIDTWPLGSVVTQGCHASVAAIWSHKDDPHTLDYCNPTNLDSMHKVTLEVKGEVQLKKLSEKLMSNNIAHKLWIEQPENYPTCLASKPYPKSVVSTFFKKLKLLECKPTSGSCTHGIADISGQCLSSLASYCLLVGASTLAPYSRPISIVATLEVVGETWSLPVAAGTQGARIWPRTNCNFDGSGRGRCETGDCNGLLQCQNYGTPPNTLAEFGLNQFNNLDFFDISLVDGFNVPMVFKPNSGGCTRGISCIADINGQCPNELRAPGGCNNPCTVYKTDQYCCNSGSCAPTDLSKFFKDRCPDAYSYPKDDQTSTFTCPGGTNYDVVFCS